MDTTQAIFILQSFIKGVLYRRKKRFQKKQILKNLLKFKKVTIEQYQNIDKIRYDLHEAQKLKKKQSFDKLSKSYLITQNKSISQLEQLITNLEFVDTRINSIPDMILAPKKIYKNLFNYSFINTFYNALKHNQNDELIKSFILLGYCNKTLKNITISIIQEYINNYLILPRLSLGKDIILFSYYSSSFGGCDNSWDHTNKSHKNCCWKSCPTKILFDISNVGIWSQTTNSIDNSLRIILKKNLQKYTSDLQKNHGIII